MDIISRIRWFQLITVLAVIGLFAIVITLAPLVGALLNPTDDTDAGPDQRSGLRLHTDYATGVQYVSAAGGGVTPRLRADGTLFTVPVTNKPSSP